MFLTESEVNLHIFECDLGGILIHVSQIELILF